MNLKLNSRLVDFRKKIRKNQKKVIDSIIDNHKASICIFCGKAENLTDEHVIPQWVYDHCIKRDFITTANNKLQTYHKTKVPACEECNRYILGLLEDYLKKKFTSTDLNKDFFAPEDIVKIILWLETIGYKLQVLDLRRTLNKIEGSEYSQYIGKMPIAMFQGPLDQSPSKVFSNLRKSLKRLSIKSKKSRHNSLHIFHTKNPSFHFFQKNNDFIFLELAKYNIALFYFYEREFIDYEESKTQAHSIIKEAYGN